MARSTSSLAARRAGQSAASAPMIMATISRTTTWAAKKTAATRLSVLRRLNLRSLPSTETGAGPAPGMLGVALSTVPEDNPAVGCR